MKNKILYFFIFILSLFLVYSFKCGHDKIEHIPKILNDSLINGKNRLLDTYQSISFFVDYTQMEYDQYGDTEYRNFLKTAIEKTLNIFSELIKVKSSGKLIIENPTDCSKKITVYDNSILTGIYSDIILVPIIDPTLENGVDAAASACFIRTSDNRPVMGYILLNQNYSINKTNAEDYLIMLLLHEITHILVFSKNLFEYYQYSGNVTTTESINGIDRTFIITSNVRNAAAKHFGCSSIIGVELENQGGTGSIGSHWEARIMLGDYMISTDYQEIVISDISLALFKDSGWYEVNYYSGGLFRFGKGQGCDFLNSFCVISGKTNFKLDFCDSQYENMCTSNNLNRGICYFGNYSYELPSYYQYFNYSYTGGWEPADYCPVPLSYSSTSYYFQSSCIYGEESNYPSSLGFVISENSICMKSSLVNASDDSLSIYSYQRSMCHQIKCNLNSQTFTVNIGQSTIICPTDGGEMQVKGYNGTITCPPFNRVCTSEIYISNPIQAVLNHITFFDLNLKNINDSDSSEDSFINSESNDSNLNLINNSDSSVDIFNSKESNNSSEDNINSIENNDSRENSINSKESNDGSVDRFNSKESNDSSEDSINSIENNDSIEDNINSKESNDSSEDSFNSI